jgi:hypothetical protein
VRSQGVERGAPVLCSAAWRDLDTGQAQAMAEAGPIRSDDPGRQARQARLGA